MTVCNLEHHITHLFMWNPGSDLIKTVCLYICFTNGFFHNANWFIKKILSRLVWHAYLSFIHCDCQLQIGCSVSCGNVMTLWVLGEFTSYSWITLRPWPMWMVALPCMDSLMHSNTCQYLFSPSMWN